MSRLRNIPGLHVKEHLTVTLLLLLSACHDRPDPRTVDGALAYAAEQIEQGSARALFRVIDQRARHAMASIVADRQAAAALVQSAYPEDTRAGGLSELGDAVGAADAATLFERRCDRSCLEALALTIGAPRRTETHDRELTVETARGTELRLYRGDDGWYGIVWNTEALLAERDDANRDLEMVRQNAEVYERRRALTP